MVFCCWLFFTTILSVKSLPAKETFNSFQEISYHLICNIKYLYLEDTGRVKLGKMKRSRLRMEIEELYKDKNLFFSELMASTVASEDIKSVSQKINAETDNLMDKYMAGFKSVNPDVCIDEDFLNVFKASVDQLYDCSVLVDSNTGSIIDF